MSPSFHVSVPSVEVFAELCSEHFRPEELSKSSGTTISLILEGGKLFSISQLGVVTKPSLSLLTRCAAKPIYWHHNCGEGKYSIYFKAPSKVARAQKTWSPQMAFREGFLKTVWGRGSQSVWSAHAHLILWFVDGEVTEWCFRNLNHQTYGSNWSGVYMLVVSMQLTSSTWWGVLVSAKQLKDMAQGIIYSRWGETKSPWLCFMAKLLLFCLAWLFSFVSAFFHFYDESFLFGTQGRSRRLMLFYKQEAGVHEMGMSLPGALQGPVGFQCHNYWLGTLSFLFFHWSQD